MGSINVNWNQWAPEINSTNWWIQDSSYEQVVFSDGIVTRTMIKQSTESSPWVSSVRTQNQIQFEKTHVYYMKQELNPSITTDYYLMLGNNTNNCPSFTCNANEWTCIKGLQIPSFYSSNNGLYRFYLCYTASIEEENVSCMARNPILVDLTQMYGAGNEPSTVEEFEHQCEINGINLNEYQPYTTGIIKSWRTSGDGTLSTATTSGNIASFWSPTRADIKSCKVYFSPIQEGSGDPSPTNVRNISGWNGITITHCGKNILDFEALLQHWGSKYKKNSNDSYNIRATGTGYHQPYEFTKDNITLSMSGSVTDSENAGRWRFELLNKSGTRVGMLGTLSGNSSGMYQVPNVSANKYRLNYGTPGDGATYENIQVELGTECTSFEPYKGIDVPISWQSEAGTLYGGYIDLISGQLVATMGYIPDLSTYEWGYRDDGNRFKTGIIPNIKTGTQRTIHLVCTTLKPIENGEAFDVNWDDVIYVAANCFYIHAHSCGSSVESLVTLLSDVGVAYELETPISYQLTPQQLTSFIGRNNIWSNSGNTEVEYDLYESADIALTRKAHVMFDDYYKTHVPPMYTEYDWLQSNSQNARIDTGVSGADDTLTIICTFMPIELADSYSGIFGNYKNENDYYCWRVILSAKTSTYFNAQLYICCGNNSAGGGGTSVLYPTFNGGSMVNKKFTVRMSYGTATITGEKEETKTTSYAEKLTNETTIAVGAAKTTNTGGSSKFRFYIFKMWSQGKLIRDYRPCVRKSDNKAGFYDMVNHTFNPSIGTADFIAGND